MAPPGHDAFYALSPVPHLDSGTDWPLMAERYRQRIEQRLHDTVLPGFKAHIVTSRVTTPQDFHDRLLSYKGAAFGMEPLLQQSAYFRPHNRSEDVRGLYMVGAGTHPGAGVPGVLMSAKALETVVPHVQNSLEHARARDSAAPACAAPPTLQPTRGLPQADARRLEELLRRVAAAAAARARAGHARCMRSAAWPTTPSTWATTPSPRWRGLRSRLDARLRRPPRRRSTPTARWRRWCTATRIPRAAARRAARRLPVGRQRPPLRDARRVHDYAARVAGTVGAMMALVMGATLAARAGPRLRAGRGDAADEHRTRCRRGRTQRPPVPAARLAARGRHRRRRLAARAAFRRRHRRRHRASADDAPTRCTAAPNMAWPNCRATAAAPSWRHAGCMPRSASNSRATVSIR